MATTIKRKATSFRLPNYLLEGLKTEAKRQNRSVNNLVEFVLSTSLFREPNAETLAAMKECKSGVELEDFDPNELDKYIYAENTEEVHTV
ncbi:MAG: toxin-antitoxin system protein [Prevotella sp.]|nr:toxin-antitoxin system protein [Prevotella sp.]